MGEELGIFLQLLSLGSCTVKQRKSILIKENNFRTGMECKLNTFYNERTNNARTIENKYPCVYIAKTQIEINVFNLERVKNPQFSRSYHKTRNVLYFVFILRVFFVGLIL